MKDVLAYQQTMQVKSRANAKHRHVVITAIATHVDAIITFRNRQPAFSTTTQTT
jgi:hypothetical protein